MSEKTLFAIPGSTTESLNLDCELLSQKEVLKYMSKAKREQKCTTSCTQEVRQDQAAAINGKTPSLDLHVKYTCATIQGNLAPVEIVGGVKTTAKEKATSEVSNDLEYIETPFQRIFNIFTEKDDMQHLLKVDGYIVESEQIVEENDVMEVDESNKDQADRTEMEVEKANLEYFDHMEWEFHEEANEIAENFFAADSVTISPTCNGKENGHSVGQDYSMAAQVREVNTFIEAEQMIIAAEAIKSTNGLEIEEIIDELPNKNPLLEEATAKIELITMPNSKYSAVEIFDDKICINFQCPSNHKQFFVAPQFAYSFYKAKRRKNEKRYVCSECYDAAIAAYEEYCSYLKSKQPLLLLDFKRSRHEYIEISDSSEDEGEEPTDCQENGSFSQPELDLIENELEGTIKKVLTDVDIQAQLTWSTTLLTTRAKKLQEETEKNYEVLRSLEKKAHEIHTNFYGNFKTNNEPILPLDINTGLQYFLPEEKEQAPTGYMAVEEANEASIKQPEASSSLLVPTKPKGKIVLYKPKRNLIPLPYKPHICGPSCLFDIENSLDSYSPLSKPLLSGWKRVKVICKSKRIVVYHGPCGKRMQTMEGVRKYLRSTENILNVDNFDFSLKINCLCAYVNKSAIVRKRDISEGKEKMAVSLINSYDGSLPTEFRYVTRRIPTDGVSLNLDPEFLVGCDCLDDCSDKSKCSCWQLTYAGTKFSDPIEKIGYKHKRLYEPLTTGIYECNSRCKCKSHCLNRVVQEPLKTKLQVFKTSNRGWGLRCVNDVPKGSFICTYAGHILNEAKANEKGLVAGDEYFADLDYIEVAEKTKEGYESDVASEESQKEEEDYVVHPADEGDEFTSSKQILTRAKAKAIELARSKSKDKNAKERKVINFDPNTCMNENYSQSSSARTLFGKDETCYIMDGKFEGNLGRFFNHSCSPNVFVQNVFVDTHDLRFPWVSFFAMSDIRSGTELTWDYNYEVGTVPGKEISCKCGASSCRLRLL